MDADYISSATEEELDTWEQTHHMTRVAPLDAWARFCKDSLIHGDIVETLECIETPTRDSGLKPSDLQGVIAEWQPAGFSLCRAAQQCGFQGYWVAPRHADMDKIPLSHGLPDFTTGKLPC